MTAKLILSMDGVALHEYLLNKERMTIGRKPHNDVVIDNLAVSGEHAAIVTILNDSFLEDLDSTNGVVVNGAAIKKHFLQSNDVIEIGKYKLKYINEQQATQATSEDFEKTMVLRAPVRSQAGSPPAGTPPAGTPSVGTPSAGAPEAGGMASVRTPASPTPVAPRETTGAISAPTPQPIVPPPIQHAPQSAPASAPIPMAALQILSGPNAGRELDLVKNLVTLGKPGVQVAVLTRRPHGYFITHVEGANYPSLNGTALNEQPHQLNNHDIIELAGIKMEFYLKD